MGRTAEGLALIDVDPQLLKRKRLKNDEAKETAVKFYEAFLEAIQATPEYQSAYARGVESHRLIDGMPRNVVIDIGDERHLFNFSGREGLTYSAGPANRRGRTEVCSIHTDDTMGKALGYIGFGKKRNSGRTVKGIEQMHNEFSRQLGVRYVNGIGR